MLIQFLSLFLICFQIHGSPLHSQQTISQSQRLLEKGRKDLWAYELTRSLTTEVGQRLAGSESEERARNWAFKKFKSMGFKNVRIENFPMKHWVRLQEEAEVQSPYKQKLSSSRSQTSLTLGIMRQWYSRLSRQRDNPQQDHC